MWTLRTILSWIIALGLIFMFLQATVHPLPNPPEGGVKLFDAPGENIVFQTLATKSGIALFEPFGRFAIAVIELIAAFFLLWPGTRKFGAFISMSVLIGAVIFHLSPWLGREIPTSLAEGAPTDGGALFMLAIAMLAASVLLMFVHPGRRPYKPQQG